MIRIYKITKEQYKEAKKILESDPYEKASFPSVGYKLREAKALGFDFDGYYVYVNSDEETLKVLDEKIKDASSILEGEEFEKVKEKFEKEEEEAQQGFGNLFG